MVLESALWPSVSVPLEGWARESELPTSPVVLLTQHWVIWWDAIQEAYTVIPCTSFMGKQRVPIFGIVTPAIPHSQSECSPTHPYMDHIGQQFSWEPNSFSKFSLQEKGVGHSEWRARLMSESVCSCRKQYTICAQLTVIRCPKEWMWWELYSVQGHSWQWNCLELSLNCFMVNSNFGHEGILKYWKRKILQESEH